MYARDARICVCTCVILCVFTRAYRACEVCMRDVSMSGCGCACKCVFVYVCMLCVYVILYLDV